MTLWKNLVVALVAAFALAACSSNDNGGSTSDETPPTANGPTQAELDAAEQARAEAEAEAEAEKKRADELQAEKDRDQAKQDLATAKALFAALKRPRAVVAAAGSNLSEGVTTELVTGDPITPARTENVTIPDLGKPDDNGMFRKKVETTQWEALVRSTQEASVSKLLAEVLASDSRYDGTLLTFGATPDPDGAIKSDSFPQEGGNRTYAPGDREFSGTYMGASGMYSCAADSCTATWTRTGIDLSGGWSFKPDDGARAVTPDSAHQSFGWWLSMNSDGEMDAGPVWYHSFGNDNGLRGFAALQGTATYRGSALGKYTIYSGAFSERSENGHFTADAELKADFGDETAGGSISGTIDTFMTAAGEKDWMVELEEDTDIASGTFSGMTTWTIDDVASDDDQGHYSGQMFDTRPDQDDLPYEAGGTFSAQFETGVGQMVGAFTATRE